MKLGDDEIANSRVIPEAHKSPLIADLKRYPDWSWLVGRPNDLPHLQGDFINEFRIAFLRPDGEVVTPCRTVMVINNTCDLEPGRSDFVTVAPVFDYHRHIEQEQMRRNSSSVASYAKSLSQNQISSVLYVPSLQGFERGAMVKLDMLCTVPRAQLEDAIQNGKRIGSFTQSGFYVLLMKLIYHLARQESIDVARPTK